jgi:hypothetical protein
MADQDMSARRVESIEGEVGRTEDNGGDGGLTVSSLCHHTGLDTVPI